MAVSPGVDEFPRELSAREAEILDFVLSAEDPRVEPLRDQRTSVLVEGLCGCGCASIKLVVDRGRHRPASLCRVPISAYPKPGDAGEANGIANCGLILFLDDGWLDFLEICWIEQPPPEFPPATAFDAPEVTCERDAAALAELERDAPHHESHLGRRIAALGRLLRRPPRPS